MMLTAPRSWTALATLRQLVLIPTMQQQRMLTWSPPMTPLWQRHTNPSRQQHSLMPRNRTTRQNRTRCQTRMTVRRCSSSSSSGSGCAAGPAAATGRAARADTPMTTFMRRLSQVPLLVRDATVAAAHCLDAPNGRRVQCMWQKRPALQSHMAEITAWHQCAWKRRYSSCYQLSFGRVRKCRACAGGAECGAAGSRWSSCCWWHHGTRRRSGC